MSFSIRFAAENDIPDLAYIHVEGWKASYGGILDSDYIASKTVEVREAQWRQWAEQGTLNALIARNENGKGVGFISYGKLKTPPPGMSPIRPLYAQEIYAFYILSDYWRQGLGTQLLKRAAAELAQDRHKSLCLWVLEKNQRACAFYKATGGLRCGKMDVAFGPDTAREVCYGWRDTSILL